MSPKYPLPSLYSHNNDGLIVIAHRGASAYYPENTMPAFKGAVEMEAEMIELDVMLSLEGVPIVFHDARLDAHTNSSGAVSNFTLSQLKKMDAGSWFSPAFAGTRIPTLEEVLKFASGTIALNIEIKSEAVTDRVEGGVEEKSLALLKKYNMQNYVLFSSFDYRAVSHLRELDSEIPLALLYNQRQSARKSPSDLVERYQANAFNCSYYQLNKRRLANLKKHGIPIFIYTVNSSKKMETLLHLGVRGIFTDKPDVLREVLRSLNQDSRDAISG